MAKYSQAKRMRLEIRRRIGALRKLNLATVKEAYLEQQVRELLNIGYVARPLLVNASKAYRVRINEDGKPFTNTKDLWYPPAKCIKAKGRANDVGESVFYYSDTENTAVIEKRPDLGDILTVLESELIDPNSHPLVMVLGIHEYTAQSNPKYGGTPPELDVKQKQFIEKEGISKTNPLLQAYLTEEFMRKVSPGNEHEYKITVAITKILMNEPEFLNEDGSPAVGITVDGFAYPSIASNNLGANVALRTESADRLYRPVAATVYRVEEKRDDTHYTLVRLKWSTSIEADGTINWYQ
jgi:hypothetical protein